MDFKDGGSLKARFLVEGKKSKKNLLINDSLLKSVKIVDSKSIFILVSFKDINLGHNLAR